MLLLNFNVLSIRAKHLLSEREAAVTAFNDDQNPVQVLVTSVKVSATSLILQKDCADVIFVDVPSNAQSTQQAAGRVTRIGQKRACSIYILTTDHSYDQVLQATAARKMIEVIAAYTNRKATAADIDEYRKQHPDATETDAEIKDVLIDDGCSEDYRCMFRQRSRREQWNNLHDLT